jgi:hypothetical protein
MQLDPYTIGTSAAVAGVVVSVAALITESRRSRSANQVNVVLDFYNRFHAEQMAQKRKAASSFLLQSRSLAPNDTRWNQVSDVLDFFQILGTFAKAGYVSTELMYKFFFFWLSPYWKASDGHIKLTQASSPMTWADAEWLHGRLCDFDQRKNFRLLSNPTSAQLDVFFRWETQNLAR